ncbi:hypothetical protein GLOIN_2v1581194 [Rhizophagus irregularis DAOM 181602=DAOM 197198]|uniref:Uncharacterized protein n=1 Tax=Rhizophagus irregularis (strain DAOM 181602 / DAOM 197198 / MUCL 43194) TaxID=747089 RepID=A0A2P4Q8K1_RHIID|nr:hypothetical protein GLOIN_2v1581194 [Rhizophagus irregularis DAOM 181602=DAOM 197198]POG73973.1 hypothetical protein GLOIN_2v1581194 [Rhizophagus irregularis DAOM 181602=DAOM 197198]|eukprot:XP_025180839.1 hypothetical protein GLOIN_2v1581194 [Rhizophagus irregularis DAOM 181602=DAOM 197198]
MLIKKYQILFQLYMNRIQMLNLLVKYLHLVICQNLLIHLLLLHTLMKYIIKKIIRLIIRYVLIVITHLLKNYGAKNVIHTV